jgi:hypothetical protein
VRAAQLHEFVDPLVGWTIQDAIAYVPEMRTQLVAAHVVAETLADAAEEPEMFEIRASRGGLTTASGERRPTPPSGTSGCLRLGSSLCSPLIRRRLGAWVSNRPLRGGVRRV